MPYIQRDDTGRITALLQHAAPDQEYLPATHPDVVAFLTRDRADHASLHALAESDVEIARVTEDLIYLLIEKNLILFTELPQAVQSKLLAREKLRTSLRGSIDNFLDDSESI